MKTFKLFSFVLLLSALFFACKQNYNPQHEVGWSQNGRDSAVYITKANPDGSYSNFWMDYLLFNNLFRSGGYPAVYRYHDNNPGHFRSSRNRNYSQYSNDYSPSKTVSGTLTGSSVKRSYSSPSRSWGSSYESPSSGRSYSSPNHSSSGSSYSSGRSYSSPSKSYSSPSRSYSSPSRSYSSPSRH